VPIFFVSIILAAATALANPAPGTPGNSGSGNPHGSPPGQGGAIPGGSGDTNPHGAPPGQRITDTPAGGAGAAGAVGGPGSSGGGSPVRPASTTDLWPNHRPWPPATPPPTWNEIARALGSDQAAFLEDSLDVTEQTCWIDPALAPSVVRHRRHDGVQRTDWIQPALPPTLVKDGHMYRWSGTGWVALTNSPAFSWTPEGGPGMPDPTGPPSVRWGSLPGQIELTFPRVHGTEVCWVDCGRKVRLRTRHLSLVGDCEREDIWEEAWAGRVRRPLKQVHLEGVPGRNFTVTWSWGISGAKDAAGDLVAAP